jgi:hypothetical protein
MKKKIKRKNRKKKQIERSTNNKNRKKAEGVKRWWWRRRRRRKRYLGGTFTRAPITPKLVSLRYSNGLIKTQNYVWHYFRSWQTLKVLSKLSRPVFTNSVEERVEVQRDVGWGRENMLWTTKATIHTFVCVLFSPLRNNARVSG